MDYIINYNPYISLPYIIASMIIFIITFFIKYRPGTKNEIRSAFFALLVTYIFIVWSFTVFCRSQKSYYDFQLSLFWSYREIIENHNMVLLSEDLLNLLLLLPIGIIYPVSVKRSFTQTAFTGLCVSASIELMQLVFKRGLFEFDDIIHNTAGVVIGYGICKAASGVTETVKKKLYSEVLVAEKNI